MTSILQLIRTGVMTIAWLVIVPCIVLIFSAIAPVIPWLRIYAGGVVPNHAPWFVVLSLTALAIGMLAYRRRATGIARALLAAGAATTLAASGLMLHLLYFAETNGAQIDLFRALSMRTYNEDAGPDRSLVYARPQGEPLWLDIYHARKRDPRPLSPVLMVVHGGGFIEGARTMGAANMRRYADRGWTVISIDYRLARPDRPTWNLATQDVRCALAWTAAHAAALGIDIDRLTLSGASAGGTLAMTAAYAGAGASPDTRCGPRVPAVAAVVVKVPLVDPLGSWREPGELRDQQRGYLMQYLGGTPEQYPARYAAADIRRFSGLANPPTLILGGAEDPLVPPEGVLAFTRRASGAGNEVRLILFPYSGHDFNTTFDGIANQAVGQIVSQFLIEHDLAPR